jgi:toxin ParE1/3/4
VKLRYTAPALADLASILDYIDQHSPAAAKRVQARIQAICQMLTRYPRAGVSTDDSTIRRMPTTPYPYAIFYEVLDDCVLIHAVRHGARDPAGEPGTM